MNTNTKYILSKYTDETVFSKIKEYDSISQMWVNCINKYSDLIAVIDNGNEYTYKDLDEDISKFRSLINSSTKRIAIYSPNSYDLVKAFLAITTLGLTAVVLPMQVPCEALPLLAQKYNYDTIVYDKALVPDEKINVSSNIKYIEIHKTSETNTDLILCEKDTPCAIMLTGGTTGKSKGALLSNEAIMQGVVNGCYGYKDVFNQKYLLVLPLSHVFGLIRNTLTCLYTGGTLYINKNPKDMFKDIAMFNPNILVLVPALAEMALNLSKKLNRNMLGNELKYIICGAATVSPYLVKEYYNFGVSLFPGYGLTESANLVSGNPESLQKPDSVGIMYPNQEYKIVDGELWLKGKNMLISYIGEEESAYNDEGYFQTGDLVRFDEDGFLYITGRIKEIIVLQSGENISPAELETEFNKLDCIQDSQVFEDITDSGNHILALEVVPRMTELTGIEDVNSFILDKLNEINASLPEFERVNKIIIRDSDFERTPSMKIVRYKKCN